MPTRRSRTSVSKQERRHNEWSGARFVRVPDFYFNGFEKNNFSLIVFIINNLYFCALNFQNQQFTLSRKFEQLRIELHFEYKKTHHHLSWHVI